MKSLAILVLVERRTRRQAQQYIQGQLRPEPTS